MGGGCPPQLRCLLCVCRFLRGVADLPPDVAARVAENGAVFLRYSNTELLDHGLTREQAAAVTGAILGILRA